MIETLLLNSLLLVSQVATPDKQFIDLKNQLEKFGFPVLIQLPPKRGAYGLLQESTKRIWINPVVFELNIGTQTLVHESVHAAQVCAGKGKIKTLGLNIQPINYSWKTRFIASLHEGFRLISTGLFFHQHSDK